MLKIFGAVGSGSIPIEATLTLLGISHEVIEAVTWEDEAARKRVETVNPLRQVPALVLPSGEIMTESAAILIYLADLYPQARLAPGLNRPQACAISTLDDLCVGGNLRAGLDQGRPHAYRRHQEDAPGMIDRVHDRIAYCWRKMDEQITPGRYIIGDEVSVLDLYVTVISRFAPGARAFTRARRRWPKSSDRSMPTRVSGNSGRSGFHLMRGGSGKRQCASRQCVSFRREIGSSL